MFTTRDLKILNKIQTKTPTVSLYLNADQRIFRPEEIRTAFRNLLKKVEKLLGANMWLTIRQRFRLRLLKNVRGLVFFVNPKENLFYEYELSSSVPSGIYLEKNLHLTPLVKMLDELERYLVAVFDKSRAKIFSVYLGEIEDLKEIYPYLFKRFGKKVERDFPGKHGMGGWSQARYARHIEAHLLGHLRKIEKILDELNRKRRFDRLILSGSGEAISLMKKILPRDLKVKLAGQFRTELFAAKGKILAQAKKIEEQIERRKEKEKTKRWLKYLGKDDKSLSGFERVVQAVNDKKVVELFLDLEVKKSGSRCFSCQSLSDKKREICFVCGERMEAVDLVDELVQNVILQNGKVEFVANNKELKKSGGVGARARY